VYLPPREWQGLPGLPVTCHVGVAAVVAGVGPHLPGAGADAAAGDGGTRGEVGAAVATDPDAGIGADAIRDQSCPPFVVRVKLAVQVVA
jgi:hypothetical protein